MSKRKSHLYERNTREAIKRERKLRVACLKIKSPRIRELFKEIQLMSTREKRYINIML
jgi:hypothetical protein